MTDSIIIALITGLCAAVPSLIAAIASARTTVYRIDQLEKKVEKHNNLVERMTVVEQSAKSAHHRIDELKD